MSFSEFTPEDYRCIEEAYGNLREAVKNRCKTEDEVELVGKAYEFANSAHRNIRRRSGEPYMLHPIAVAQIVVSDIGLGCKSICAALLHDVVEDTNYTVEDIRNIFGDKIASLVDGLTKLKTVLDNQDRQSKTESLQAENFKRILLTMNDDVRVVLIKLADRLHNCRTIEFMPEHKRDKILSETMYVFVPLAHRLGLYSVKSEMENIWLRYKEPDDYLEITERLSISQASKEHQIDEFIAPINDEMLKAGYKFRIIKRIKTPYSIWYKMKKKKVPFEQIYDLYAVRIIFEPADETPHAEKSQSYLIYSLLTSLYYENPNRRRDWISKPKSNGYEALHCTLMSRAGVWIEVQIRSKRMDDIAEKGIAAHWIYKESGYASETHSEVDKWLAEVQEILQSKDITAIELLDIIHKDLVSSDIVVFTPKGDQKTMPAGSTALDFAFQIHTKVGYHAIAAKVNMKLVTLSQVLKSGDQVEIITAVAAKPKVEWLQFLHTRHAKNKVVDYFHDSRDEFIVIGEKIYKERLDAMGLQPTNEIIRKFLEYMQLSYAEDLYFRIGVGLLGPEDFRLVLSGDPSLNGEGRSVVMGETRQEYIMAQCCKPIPGDAVVGFKSADNTIIIHKKTCSVAESLASKFGNRVVVPQWSVLNQEYPIRISLRGIDRVGLLSEISGFISKTMGINMRKITLSTDDGLFEGYIELLVKDKKNLESMLDGLKKIEGIQDIVRTDI